MPMLDMAHGPLYYEVHDMTPPWIQEPATVLFCHGVGTNADIWSDWLPTLADRFRLVRFDTRGFGRSGVPGRGFNWTLNLLAEDILAVARATDAGRFHLVGESLGGTVALYLATRGSLAPLSVTACSTAARGSDIRHVNEWRILIEREGMARWSADMMPKRFGPGAVDPAIYAWFDKIQKQTSPDSLLDLADLLIGTDLTGELDKIELPVLLLTPDSSPFVTPEMTIEIHRRIRVSEMQVFPAARHGLACSHGRACAETLKTFLQRHGFG